MNPATYQEIKNLFDEYMEQYLSRDDLLTQRFSSDFSGFGGGGNTLVKDRTEWIAITRQDFAQVKGKLQIDIKDLAIQSLSEDVAVVTSFFSIKLPIEDDYFSRETARLVLIFHKEAAAWKIAHSSISIPYSLVEAGEIYPLKGLQERNKSLEQIISERTAELEQANRALKESQSLYHSFIDQLPNAVFRKDREGRYVLVNSEFCRLKNLEKEDFIGRTPMEIANSEISKQGEDGQAAKYAGIGEDTHELILRTGKTFRSEEEYPGPDGSPQYMYVVRMPVFDSSRTIIGTQGIMFDISERKRVEEALTYERNLLKALLDNTPDHVYFKDKDSHFLRISRSQAIHFGFDDPAQAVGKTDFDFFAEEHARAAFEDEQKVMNSGIAIVDQEEEESWTDGRKKWVSTTKIPMRDAQGEIIGTFGVSRDITERRRVEAALRESEQNYKTLADSGRALVWTAGADALCNYFNSTWLKFTGRTLEQELGNGWADGVHADDLQRCLDIYLGAFDRREPFSMEYRLRRYDGEYRWILDDGSPRYDSKGLFIGYIGHCLDVTERKRAEEATRESEEKFRRIFDFSPVGVVMVGLDRKFMACNDAFCTFLGYEASELLEETFLSVTHPEDKEIGMPELRELAQGIRDSAVVQKRYLRKDGKVVWGESSLRILRHPNGAPMYFLAVVQDIAERKRAELERQVMYEIIEGMAAAANLDDFFKLMHRSLQKVLYAENCFIALFAQDTGLFSFPYFVDKFDSTPQPAAMPKSCTGYVFRSRKPLHITPAVFKELQEQNEVGLIGSPSPSWIGVPLQTPSRTIGVLVLQHYEKEDVYSKRDLRFLTSIGSQVAAVIERKQAEAAIRDSEANLNVILESTADGILAVDSKGKVLRINERFSEMWRIPQSLVDSKDDDGLLDWVLRQLVDPEAFLSKVRSLYASADEDRDTLHFKDGRVFERFSAPIMMVGCIVGRVWSFRDITERKRAEDKLRQSELRFRSVWDHSADGMRLTDREGQIVDVNEAFCRLVKKSRAELLGQPLSIAYRNEGPHDNLDLYHKRFDANETLTNLLGSATLWNGESIELDITSSFIETGGQERLLLALFRDVTEHKRAENALRESEERLRDIMFSMADWVWEIDNNGFYTYSSQKRFNFFGPTRKDVIGKTPFDFMPPDEAKRVGAIFSEMVANKAPIKDLENWNIQRNGERICLLTNGVPILDDAGNLKGYRGVDKDITDRKRAEKALQESSELFRLISGLTTDYIFLDKVADDGKLEPNLLIGALERITGYTEEEFKSFGQRRSTVHPDDLEKDDRDFQKLCNNEKVVSEIRTIHKNGSIRWMRIYAHPIWDYHANRLVGISGAVQDITERKQSEETLRTSEERFRRVFQHSASGMVLVSPDFVFLQANDAFCRMLGYAESELIGKSFQDMTFPEDRLVGGQLVRTVLAGETDSFELEKRYVHKDGTVVWGLVSSTLIRDTQNRPLHFVTQIQDITERKRAEEELRSLTERLRLATAAAKAGVWDWNLQTNEMIWDDRMHELYGTTTDQFIGGVEAWKRGLHPEDAHRAIEECESAIRGEKDFDTGFRVLHPDGKIVYIKANGFVVRDENSTPLRMTGLNTDVTEFHQAAEALRHAQKSESIGTLAGGIAHDFNNLLNAMLGQSTLAINKLPKGSLAKDHIEKSIKAAERAADLTRQLLAYSGKGKFVTEQIDLNQLVEENAQLLEVSVAKTTQIRYELDAVAPCVRGDVGQIQQVVMNLIINAGEAMGANPGTITIRTSRIDLTHDDAEYWKYTNSALTPGTYALLQVSDTGSGMKPEVLARIFDPFFTTKFTGRGLGLAAVLGIVRGHQGGIRISSEEGKGTRFDVVFPLMESPNKAAVQEAKETLAVNGEGRSILVIDDEASVLELLTDIFTDAKFTVIGALNPLEGIELYRRHQPGIAAVVLDYSMPGMDGKAAFEELVKINKDVQVLLCSGYSEEETSSVFGDVRPVGFIQKPYQPAALLERVSRLI
jgi:PAS domain S-box-containing protein